MLEQARSVAHRIITAAKNASVQVFIRMKKGALIRFTNNGVHQNGFQDLFFYTLRVLTKEGPRYIESNDLSHSGIQDAIHRLLDQAQPIEAPPLLKKKVYPKIKEHFALPLNRIEEQGGQTIEEGVRLIRRKQASANGYYSAYERLFYLRRGDFEVFHPSTAVRFGVTITKGSGKGYFSFYHPDQRKLKVGDVVEKAMAIVGEASRNEVSLRPGEYECVFSPRAFLELIEPLRRHFDSKLTQDQKSVFSGMLGKPLFSKVFSMVEDLKYPGQFGIPFDAEGVPKNKTILIKDGVLKELLAEGHSTRGLAEHPFYPQNLVVEKGNLGLKELFRRVRRGIFINKIWYHTLVRESEMEVTGLATAGSLYLEKGRVLGRVVHLRYHDSLFSILHSVVAASREQILLKDGEFGAALFPYLWVSRLKVV